MTILACRTAAGQTIVDKCRYTTKQPIGDWQQTEFNDSDWKIGYGGFGKYDTNGGRVATRWTTSDIWLRKNINIDSSIEKPALLIYHDEDVEVYINGKLVAELKRYTTSYRVIPIDSKHKSALKLGENLLAVHCHQTDGGQCIDVHLVDQQNVPNLPPVKRPDEPFKSELITPWGQKVTPANCWKEYPRPLLRREDWQNLNGKWDYCIASDQQRSIPTKWDGEIQVPFPLESQLSGVQRLLHPDQSLWYSRVFRVDAKQGKRTIINFEAVDYSCEVFVNGKSIGTHVGGNTPFSFDITDSIRSGENRLVVRVEDDTEGYQLRGKQALKTQGVWYTRVSGIWQTVWLEQVSDSYLSNLKISTDADKGSINIHPAIVNKVKGSQLRIVVKDQTEVIKEITSSADKTELILENAKLWSPDSPHLYDLEIELIDGNNLVLDQVKSYAGIRSVGKVRDSNGHMRFTLNGKIIFHWGTLDQGWWPDGLMTPPSDEAMQFEVNWLKEAGFNMIRKHIKVEPRRYYYHCDRIGMMVWQDQISGGISRNNGWPDWTRLKPNPVDADWPKEYHQQFMYELEQMITLLESQPSIVCWVPFNEAWGQHESVKVGEWTVKRDPSRLVNIASGGNFWPVGDIVDAHRYPHPGFPFNQGKNGRFDKYIKVVGEFGGHGYPVEGHIWDTEQGNWGYGGLPKSKSEFKERYLTSIKRLNDLRKAGVAAGVYTQTTDVEGEINGLMTYDRKVEKIIPSDLSEIHEPLFESLSTEPSLNRKENRSKVSDAKPTRKVKPDKIRKGLLSHDRALYIKTGWIRDPFITLGPDDYYYLTGTQARDDDPRQFSDPYNIGLGDESIVGDQVRVYRSKDLIDWESLGPIFTLKDTYQADTRKNLGQRIWAPELHFLGDRWALVHCPQSACSLALSEGIDLKGPWSHPMQNRLGKRHDPSLFQEEGGSTYLLWGNTLIAPLTDNLANYAGRPRRIDPSSVRMAPNNKPIRRIGHEGATIIKVGSKYVHFGTAWSTDGMRTGSYNLYYCLADNIEGPYGPRRFAGRFLGHGTPFQTRDGKWWCTAFFNANVPPLSVEGIQNRDLRETAQTINEQGVTIVPLDVKILEDGEVFIRAKDPAYASPGPEESQKF